MSPSWCSLSFARVCTFSRSCLLFSVQLKTFPSVVATSLYCSQNPLSFPVWKLKHLCSVSFLLIPQKSVTSGCHWHVLSDLQNRVLEELMKVSLWPTYFLAMLCMWALVPVTDGHTNPSLSETHSVWQKRQNQNRSFIRLSLSWKKKINLKQ
jgi:hypothetical protein